MLDIGPQIGEFTHLTKCKLSQGSFQPILLSLVLAIAGIVTVGMETTEITQVIGQKKEGL